jgi:hypothetical protein
MTEPLPDSLPGEQLDLGPPGLPIACYRAQPAGGSAARPLLLVHSINAAASAEEMRRCTIAAGSCARSTHPTCRATASPIAARASTRRA